MQARFTGAHIHKDCLKVGIAFYPSESDKSYAVQHILQPVIPDTGIPGGLEGEDYSAWLDSLPKVWVTNPAFTHFIKIDPSFTKTQLEQEIQRIFTPDILTSADAFLSDRSATHRQNFSRYRKMMADKERLGNGLILPKGYNAQGLITAANNKFKSLGDELDGKGRILDIKPGTITIGAAATDRGDNVTISNFTCVEKEGSADGDGEITSYEIFLYSYYDGEDVWLGTYSASGNVLTCRDSESIGVITAGSKQTGSGLHITVETGDYFGSFDKRESGSTVIEADSSGGSGLWTFSGECIDPSDSETFGSAAGYTISLYGEGAAAALTITDAGGIASAEAFGGSQVNLWTHPSGVASVEAFGNAITTGPIITTGISSSEAFESPKVNLKILASAIASLEAFGAAQLNYILSMTGIASLEAFGTPIVSGPIIAVGITSDEAFGTPQINLIVFPSGITSEEAVGALQVNLNILAQAIASAEAFGAPIIAGPISVSGIASLEAFGTAQLNFIVYPSGIASAEAFGTASVNLVIKPVAIATAEAFGTPQVNFILLPSSITSLEAFGTPIIAGPITATGIPSAEAFGMASVNFILYPLGISTEEAFGTPTVKFVIIAPPGLPYIVELHNSAGELVDIIERAYGVSLTEAINEAPILEFQIPGDEDKLDDISRSYELWLRDYETGTLLKKFLLYLERKIRE